MAENDLSNSDESGPEQEKKERVIEEGINEVANAEQGEERVVDEEINENANAEEEENSGDAAADVSEPDENDLQSSEELAEDALSEDDAELAGESSKKSKKKLIVISSLSFGVLILIVTATILFFGNGNGGEKTSGATIAMPPGYIASVTIPARKRKRMKTGLELSRERSTTKNPTSSPFSNPTPNKSEPQINAAFESANKTELSSSRSNPSNTKSLTAQVIGARMIPGKGLVMPSVTAAAYNSIPLKQKSKPVAAPDEGLMETVNDKVLPKLSSNGKGSWQTYNHQFKPSFQEIRTGEGEETKSIQFPRISIIIRGIGLNRNATLAAINKLPAAISLVFNPYGKSMEEWASLARGAGHETLMSLPMEPADFPALDPGPLSLLTDLKLEENIARLHSIMDLSQAYIGLVQHMGSRFTTSEAAFRPIIKVLKERGLLFIDDGLVKDSLGVRLATDNSLPHARSDLLIDDDASGVQIAQNLAKLEQIAKKNQSTIGLAKKNYSAIGIGEAYPATIMQIARWARTLKGKMIDLAPVSAVVRDNFQKPTQSVSKNN